MSKGQISSLEGGRKWKKKNPEKVKKNRETFNEWVEENRPEINKQRRERKKQIGTLCSTRKKHLKNMKDDPESMSKAFMDTLFNTKCDD